MWENVSYKFPLPSGQYVDVRYIAYDAEWVFDRYTEKNGTLIQQNCTSPKRVPEQDGNTRDLCYGDICAHDGLTPVVPTPDE